MALVIALVYFAALIIVAGLYSRKKVKTAEDLANEGGGFTDWANLTGIGSSELVATGTAIWTLCQASGIDVTYSHHSPIRLEVGVSYSMALLSQVSISYPRVSRGSFSPGNGWFFLFFYELCCSQPQYPFSFIPDIDSCVYIPVHDISAGADICPV